MRAEVTLVVAGSLRRGAVAGLLAALAEPLEEGRLAVILSRGAPFEEGAVPDGVRIIEAPRGTTVPRLRTLGVAAVTTPWVALTEDFCVPADGWAAALWDAIAAPGAVAVGGPVDRRDGGGVAWASTLCEYGRFLARDAAEEVVDLPEVNVCYHLERLRSLVGAWPAAGHLGALHARLQAASPGALRWAPRLKMLDASRPALGAAIRAQYHHGRLYGGWRTTGRSPASRAGRALLSPLVPAVAAARIARRLRSPRHAGRALAALPALGCLLAAWAAGEGVGSLLGAGRSEGRWT